MTPQFDLWQAHKHKETMTIVFRLHLQHKPGQCLRECVGGLSHLMSYWNSFNLSGSTVISLIITQTRSVFTYLFLFLLSLNPSILTVNFPAKLDRFTNSGKR